MAYITTIRYDGTLNGEPWLIYKYPDEQFLSGTRLVEIVRASCRERV